MKEKVRFLGLDVHAETIAVAVAEQDGEVRSLGTIVKREESIRKLVKKLGPVEQLRACYEAGPTGYVLYWQLTQLGVECAVVAPTLVPVKAGDRVKTDRSGCREVGAQSPVRRFDSGVGCRRRLGGTAGLGSGAGGGQAGSVAGTASTEQVPAAHRPASGDGVEGVDGAPPGLGPANPLFTAGAGVHAAGLSAPSAAHG
jgi:hypothetical protein